MTKELEFSLIFVSGAITGAVTSWFIVKDKYEKQAREEIDKIRKHYLAKKVIREEVPAKEVVAPYILDSNKSNESLAGTFEYIGDILEDYHAVTDIASMHPSSTVFVPSIVEIDGDYFGEFDDYECITLTAFLGDGVICDDMMEPLDDRKSIVGNFDPNDGEETIDGCRYIRNDHLRCDYEIVIEDGSYSDYILKHPSDSPIQIIDEEEE